jgi:hypothetical protein
MSTTQFRIRGETGQERIDIMYQESNNMVYLAKDYVVRKGW